MPIMLPIQTQSFLQVLSNEGIMSAEDVRREAVSIFGEECSENQIAIINRQLKRYNFVIKSAICELTGQKYWIFTSDTIDKSIKYPTEFTDVQLEFLRKVFSEIINSDDGHISSIDCINIGSEITSKFTPLQAESFLRKLQEQKWLSMKEGKVFMGVRSIGELMSYFKESYVDGLHICPACNKNIFHGYRCENCESLAHFHCLLKIAKFQRNLKCSSCRANIDVNNLPQINKDSMEMDTMDDDADEAHGSQASRKAKKSQKSQHRGK